MITLLTPNPQPSMNSNQQQFVSNRTHFEDEEEGIFVEALKVVVVENEKKLQPPAVVDAGCLMNSTSSSSCDSTELNNVRVPIIETVKSTGNTERTDVQTSSLSEHLTTRKHWFTNDWDDNNAASGLFSQFFVDRSKVPLKCDPVGKKEDRVLQSSNKKRKVIVSLASSSSDDNVDDLDDASSSDSSSDSDRNEENKIQIDVGFDDHKLSKEKKTKSNKRCKFDELVEVIPIPTREEYSERIRKRLWSSASELHQNAVRNTIEFAADGWDWRSVTEDENMYVCCLTGKLIHPVHYEINNKNKTKVVCSSSISTTNDANDTNCEPVTLLSVISADDSSN